MTVTDSTAPAPAPTERSFPVDAMLTRYRNELAAKTHLLYVAQATAEAAEAEVAELRRELEALRTSAEDPEA